jgi:hypothetical protein
MVMAGFMHPIIYCNNNSWKRLIDSSVGDKFLASYHFGLRASPTKPLLSIQAHGNLERVRGGCGTTLTWE